MITPQLVSEDNTFSGVTKDQVLSVLRGIEDFSSIRMIRLQPRQQSRRQLRRGSSIGGAAATDLPNHQTAGGLFVGLLPPEKVLFGFDSLVAATASTKKGSADGSKSKAGVAGEQHQANMDSASTENDRSERYKKLSASSRGNNEKPTDHDKPRQSPSESFLPVGLRSSRRSAASIQSADGCEPPKTLLLGMSYIDIEAHMENNGCSKEYIDSVFEDGISDHLIHDALQSNIISTMDMRDLLRILAMQAYCGVDVYTVSLEDEDNVTYRTDRHAHTTFNHPSRLISAFVRSFGNLKFRQIILDYFWEHDDADANWDETLFRWTLPVLVSYLDTNGSIFLPFCLPCLKKFVSARQALQRLYKIEFETQEDLTENMLWSATRQIDPLLTQHDLGIRREKEESLCMITPQQVLEEGEMGSDEEIEPWMRVLFAIENFEEVRMIRLSPRAKNIDGATNEGGFVGFCSPEEALRGFRLLQETSLNAATVQHELIETNDHAEAGLSTTELEGKDSAGAEDGTVSSSRAATDSAKHSNHTSDQKQAALLPMKRRASVMQGEDAELEASPAKALKSGEQRISQDEGSSIESTELVEEDVARLHSGVQLKSSLHPPGSAPNTHRRVSFASSVRLPDRNQQDGLFQLPISAAPYLVLTILRVKVCTFTEQDQVVTSSTRLGAPGFACRACGGSIDDGSRVFPSADTEMSTLLNMSMMETFYKHLAKTEVSMRRARTILHARRKDSRYAMNRFTIFVMGSGAGGRRPWMICSRANRSEVMEAEKEEGYWLKQRGMRHCAFYLNAHTAATL